MLPTSRDSRRTLAPSAAPAVARGSPAAAVLPLAPPRGAPSRAATYAVLARLLHEEFDVARGDVRPDATLAGLGLAHLHWWALHEAMLETLPQLGTHPLFDDTRALALPLAALVHWAPVDAAGAAGAKRASVHPLHAGVRSR